jgi:simple sugar transport system substrate-binding protein
MKLVTDRIPCSEDQELSKQKTLELLKAYPDLKGIIGFGSLGPPGAAQAIREKWRLATVAVVGTVIPAHAAPYLKDGSLKHGILWDPRDAGYGMTWAAKQVLDKKEIRTGGHVPHCGTLRPDGDVITVGLSGVRHGTHEVAGEGAPDPFSGTSYGCM